MEEDEDEVMMDELAIHLKEKRVKRGWSVADLARKAGLPEQIILDYEANPSKLDLEDWLPLHHALTRFRAPCRFPNNDEMWTDNCIVSAASSLDQGRFREALQVIEEAFKPGLELMCEGRLLLTKAAVLGEMGREERALQTLEKAEVCFTVSEDEREPALWLRLRLDQLYFLCNAESFSEAEALLAEARELAADEANSGEKLELSWLEGRIASGLGRWDEALAILQQVRATHLAAGQPFETACAALDMAAVLACQGDLSRIDEIARELEPLTTSKRLKDLSRSTLRLFSKAVGRGLKPETGRRFAAEFRKTDTRLTRPYPIPGWE